MLVVQVVFRLAKQYAVKLVFLTMACKVVTNAGVAAVMQLMDLLLRVIATGSVTTVMFVVARGD